MLRQHLVRFGILGQVGRFAPSDAASFPRGTRVVCRSNRGLEVGEVLNVATENTAISSGSLLRRVTLEDELILARLEKNKDEAFAACTRLIREHNLNAILMDVEHLFDGQSLLFYFLGDTTPELTALTEQLAEAYEAKVQFRKFTETLSEGCGPACGTEEAEGHGCGSGGCSTCAVVSACRKP